MASSRSRTWSDSIERVLQRSYAVVATVFLAYFVKLCLTHHERVTPLSITSMAFIAGVMVYTIAWCLLVRCNAANLVPVWAAMLAAHVLDSHLNVGAGTGSDANAAITFFSVVSLMCSGVIVGRVRYGLMLTALCGTYLMGKSLSAESAGLRAGGEELILLVPVSVAAYFLVSTLRQAATRSDAAEQDAVAARGEELVQRERDATLVEVRRLLHDNVIAALRSISIVNAATDRHQLANACRQAADAVEATAPEPAQRVGTFEEMVRKCVSDSPLDIDIQVDTNVAEVPAGPNTIVSIVAAVGEALRNVERHSGQRSAEIVMARAGAGLAVDISDRGHGFDPGSAKGFGILNSIVARIVAVGGTAEIDSGVGGTTVRLLWDPESAHGRMSEPTPSSTGLLEATYWATADVVGDLRTFYLLVGGPMLVGNVALAAIYASRSERPLRSVLMILAVTVVTMLVYRRLLKGPLSRSAVLSYVIMVWAVLTIGLVFSAPPGSLRGFESWINGFAALPIAALVFVLPPRWAATLLTGSLLVLVAIAVYDPVVNPITVFSALIGPVLTGGFSALVGAKLRAIARAALIQRVDRAATQSLAAQRVARQQVRTEHLGVLDLEVTPFLRGVDRDQLDPADERVRRRAVLLAAQVRDDLNVPGFLNGDLRLAIGRARSLGCQVDIRASDIAGEAQFHNAASLLRSGLRSSRPAGQLTLTLPTMERRWARLVIVPVPTKRDEVVGTVTDLGGTIEADDDAMVLTVPARVSMTRSVHRTVDYRPPVVPGRTRP